MPVRASDFSMSSINLKSISSVLESPTEEAKGEKERWLMNILTQVEINLQTELSTHQHSEVEHSKQSQPLWA